MAPESLREFIERRRTEIKVQRAALLAELRELDLVEQTLGKSRQDSVQGADSGVTASTGTSMTIKEMTIDVLRPRPEGADAQTIINLIIDKFGAKIPRTSLSPQLSRLRDEGALERNGKFWKVAASQKGEGPDASTSGPLSVGVAGSPGQSSSQAVSVGSTPTTSTSSSSDAAELPQQTEGDVGPATQTPAREPG